MKKEKDIKEIFNELSLENKNILMLVIKAMQVSANGVEVSIKRKLA